MRGWNRLTCEPRKSGNGGPSFDTLKSVFTTVLAVRVIAVSFDSVGEISLTSEFAQEQRTSVT